MGEQENFDQRDADADKDANAAANIGLTLHEARQQRNLTFEDVEKDTKIRVRYLEAMERGDYNTLPGAVYAQGFSENLRKLPEPGRRTACPKPQGPAEEESSNGRSSNGRPRRDPRLPREKIKRSARVRAFEKETQRDTPQGISTGDHWRLSGPDPADHRGRWPVFYWPESIQHPGQPRIQRPSIRERPGFRPE